MMEESKSKSVKRRGGGGEVESGKWKGGRDERDAMSKRPNESQATRHQSHDLSHPILMLK